MTGQTSNRAWRAALLALSLTMAVPTGRTAAQTMASKGKSMSAPIVFFDIAGPDVKKLGGFYATVFGWDISADGRFSVAVTPRLDATLRQDPADKLLYIGVDDVTASLANVAANGGTIDAPRFEVKGVVVLGLFRDPAGNRMGLVEMADGKAKIP